MTLPPTRCRHGQRGPLPTYGKERIDLAKRAGQQRGWRRLECVQYGERVVKQIKTFQATWRPAGGCIGVVLVREDDGWLAYFCTDPEATATQVLEALADRGAIEVAFCDAKQRLGFHDPQVWLAPAVERATPMAWLVGTLVVLWYAESGKDGVQARRRRPWYRHRPSLTFADMLASCRLQLWRHWLGQGGGLHAGREEKWAWLLEYLATAT